MKWWERLRQVQKHRWLPFFLPVIGTLLYIIIAVLLVPSELADKGDKDSDTVESEKSSSEKSAVDVNRPKATGRAARKRTLPPTPGAAPQPAPVPASP